MEITQTEMMEIQQNFLALSESEKETLRIFARTPEARLVAEILGISDEIFSQLVGRTRRPVSSEPETGGLGSPV